MQPLDVETKHEIWVLDKHLIQQTPDPQSQLVHAVQKEIDGL